MRLTRHSVSTRSRPKAAGAWVKLKFCLNGVSTRSRPKAAGSTFASIRLASVLFQHAAARRRLGQYSLILSANACFNTQPPEGGWKVCYTFFFENECFNTQPPEGGWIWRPPYLTGGEQFQHAAARRRLVEVADESEADKAFQHAAARRRLGFAFGLFGELGNVSTRSRPKAAGYG